MYMKILSKQSRVMQFVPIFSKSTIFCKIPGTVVILIFWKYNEQHITIIYAKIYTVIWKNIQNTLGFN